MLNSVTIAGNLGQDPEMRYTQDGLAIATLNIAVNEFRRNPEGDPTKITHWFRAVAFGRTAEVAAEYLHKGSKVAIQGVLVHRTWQDQHGNNRSSVEIRVNQLEFMSNGEQSQRPASGARTTRNYPEPSVPPQSQAPAPDDDIPF